ncbi:MAG: Gfo/Idh/MocA family oxidoreductase [Geminicoccaceae bacterium]
MTKPLRIGMIGCGFMGRAHSNAYRRVENFFPELQYRPVLQAVCARDASKRDAFAAAWGYQSTETDWRKLVERADIDAVDICVPNNLHQEIALAAAAAGKMILCEKPLAMDVAEGEAMVAAVEAAGLPTMVWYNYRRVPSVSLARQLIEEGRIGRPYHYRAQFLQDWTIAEDVPQGGAALWRLDVAAAGSGVTGDLLAHNIDTAMWLNGPITRVMAETETFVKQRLHQESGKVEPVGIDDACMFMCRFANGSMGLFESTRYARGHKALKTFELNGADGSVMFDLHEPEYLDFFEYRARESGEKVPSHTTGWRRIHVTNGEHPYMGHWWVPGLVIGYEHSFIHAVADFLQGLETGVPAQPDFRAALETQKVCKAVLRSARSGRWEETGVAA